MERGHCDGWIHLVLLDNDPVVRTLIKHKHDHPPYEDIDLPQKWVEFIKNNLEMSPARVFVYFYFS